MDQQFVNIYWNIFRNVIRLNDSHVISVDSRSNVREIKLEQRMWGGT